MRNSIYRIRHLSRIQRIRNGAGSDSFSPNLIPGFVAAFIPPVSLTAGLLFQDLAETIRATANNEPVRVVVCPWSGIKWTAPSDAARGLLKISGGKSWVQTDGVDDNYIAGDLSSFFSGSGTISYLADVLSIASSFEIIVTQLPDVANTSFARFTGDGKSYPGQLRSNRVQSQNGIGSGANTVSVISNSTFWRRRTNGVQDVDATPATPKSGVFSGGNLWRIGSASDSLGFVTNPFNGNLIGMAAFSRVLQSEELAVLELYLQGLYA